MIRRSISLAAMAANLAMLSSGASAAELRQPLKQWTVDYGETACSALTTFGSAERPMTFALRLSPHGRSVQLMVVRQARAQEPEHLPASVGFAGQKLETTALRYSTADRKVQIVSMSFPREALAALRSAPRIDVDVKGVVDEAFALPNIQSVFKQLDHCQTDLQAHWNIGEAATASFKVEAEPERPLASYVSSDDYPTQAIRDGAGGTAGVALMVDADGRLRDCLVEETSGVASLDAMTCIVMARARFHPAKDAADKPVRSVLTTRMTWRMELSGSGPPSRSLPSLNNGASRIDR